MKAKQENGYFTVEAALVFPIVLAALLLIVYLFVFQYDRCLLEQDISLLALYASTLDTKESDYTRLLLKKKMADIYMDKYAAWNGDGKDIVITMNYRQIEVTGQGSLTFPAPGWNLFTNRENQWEVQYTRKLDKGYPVVLMRRLREKKEEGGNFK